MAHRTLREIINQRDPVCAGPQTTVRDGCRHMADMRVKALLIVDHGKPVGIFTKRDLIDKVVVAGLDPETTALADVMTTRMESLDADRLGFEAVRVMRAENIRHLIVTGLDGGFGVLSIHDILGAEMADFENELAFETKVWEEV